MKGRHIVVEVIGPPDGIIAKGDRRIVYTAPQGRVWKEDARERLIDHLVEFIDHRYSEWEFRMVECGWEHIKFIYVKERVCATPSETQSKLET